MIFAKHPDSSCRPWDLDSFGDPPFLIVIFRNEDIRDFAHSPAVAGPL